MTISSIALRVILFLSALFIVFTGTDVTFGGINTLGLDGRQNFIQVTNENMFLIQDSHVRFLGGLWIGIGLLFLVSTFMLERMQTILKFCFVLIFIGGLGRFTQMNMDVLVDPHIIGSLVAELVGMVILYFWVSAVCNAKQDS